MKTAADFMTAVAKQALGIDQPVGKLAAILAAPKRPAPRFLVGDQVCELDRHEVWTVDAVKWTGTGWRIEATWQGCKASGPERGYRPATDADRAYRAPPMSERARWEAMHDSGEIPAELLR